MQTRYYVVSEPNHTDRLIEAANPAQAIRHCAKRITARVAKSADVVRLMAEGVKLEIVSKEGE